MNKQIFWRLIEETNTNTKNQLVDCNLLIKKLAKLDDEEIFTFYYIFREYHQLSYKNKLWAAAYVINGGCSDDGFDYFRAWLIGQGEVIFKQTLQDPDSLVTVCEADFGYEDEDLLGVATEAFFSKYQLEAAYGLFYEKAGQYKLSEQTINDLRNEIKFATDINLDWNEENLKEVVPNLYAKFC